VSIASELKAQDFSLALSGGGALGFAHLGVLSDLEKANLMPSEILGTSMGGIIGALYAIGLKETQISKIVGEFASITRWVKFSFSGNAIVDTKKVESIFKSIFKDKKLKDTQIPLKIVATELKSSKKVVFSSKDNIKITDALLATMAIPGIFKEHTINNNIYLDGFLCENLPILDATMPTTLAVDVLGANSYDTTLPNNFFKTQNVIEMFEKSLRTLIYNQTRTNLTLAKSKILLVEPNTKEYKTFSFHKLQNIKECGLGLI
jgi:NTE family protein